MGVRGLATLAKTYQAAISDVLEFPVSSPSSSSQKPTVLSIDAWAWVFQVWSDHFGESVQGGNYADLIEFVKDAVAAWRACSLEPVFFWDGPVPLIKQSVYIDRRAAVAAGNSAFMRSSPNSRSTIRFQLESYAFVPFLSHAVKAALADEGVKSVTCQTEADGAVAAHADDTGGLAASLDSDFFILCSRGSGQGRYTPVDSWEYIVERADDQDSSKDASELEVVGDGDGDGFERVTSKRRRNRSKGPTTSCSTSSSHSLPYPPSRISLSENKIKSIKLRVFYPHKLAAQLRIPPALLPLLGAVAGNDYSSAVQTTALFRHLHTGPDKVKEAAEVIHREWIRTIGGPGAGKQVRRAAPAAPRSLEAQLAAKNLSGVVRDPDDDARSEYSDASSATATPHRMVMTSSSILSAPPAPLDPVRHLVSEVVSSLLDRTDSATHRSIHISKSEKEACIASIIESMAMYSLLDNFSTTALDDTSCFWSRVLPEDANRLALQSYRTAFEAGKLSEQLVLAIAGRVVVTTLAPEDPDQKTIHVGATRSIRQWIYAIMFGVWGMEWARESMAEPTVKTNDGDAGEDKGSTTSQIFTGFRRPYQNGEKPDDVISVDTESESGNESGGEVQGEDLRSRPASCFDEDEDDADRATYAPSIVKPPPAVREYVRKGDRFVGEWVQIVKLPELLAMNADTLPSSLAELHAQYLAARSEAKPSSATASGPTSDPLPPLAPLLPIRTRLDIYRHSLHSANPSIEALPLSILPLAASLRHIVCSLAKETGESKKRLNWTFAEVTSAILAGCHVATVHTARMGAGVTTNQLLPRSAWVQPTTRAIHLSSTLQLVLEAADQLASSLLLNFSTQSEEDICLPPPHVLFDGPIFHLIMAHEGKASKELGVSDEARKLADQVLQAVLADGIKDDLAISTDELKRLRKESKKKAKAAAEKEEGENDALTPPISNGTKTKGKLSGSHASLPAGKNAFELLMER